MLEKVYVHIACYFFEFFTELRWKNTVINGLCLMLQIESLSVTFHGHDLIVDSELELNYGRLVIIPSIVTCCA